MKDRLADRERKRKNTAAWRAANPEKARAQYAKWRQDNPEKHAASLRKAALKRKYGVTQEQFRQMLARQGGGCAVCRRTETSNGHDWTVDHDHVTGKIRGLLCSQCNSMLGMAGDSKENLQRGIRYLELFERGDVPSQRPI